MVKAQPGGFHNCLNIVQSLPDLCPEICGQTAIRFPRALSGDIKVVTGVRSRRVETICASRRLLGSDSAHLFVDCEHRGKCERSDKESQ